MYENLTNNIRNSDVFSQSKSFEFSALAKQKVSLFLFIASKLKQKREKILLSLFYAELH